jgi:hypothetical protein
MMSHDVLPRQRLFTSVCFVSCPPEASVGFEASQLAFTAYDPHVPVGKP